MLRAIQLSVNYELNPIGITGIPKFGWKIESDKKSVLQTSYRLQISEVGPNQNIVYDSGLVEKDLSVGILAEELELKSLKKYSFQVCIVDNYNEKSNWSEKGYFVTGLLDNVEWKAKFITAEEEKDADNSKGTYVRTDFKVDKKVQEAFVCATGLGIYKLYINGQETGGDELKPGWTSYKKHLLYQVYEVTDILKVGHNAIGGMLGAGWYKGLMGFLGRRNNYGKQTGFLCQLLIRYEDGEEQLVVTDEHWMGNNSPVLFSEIYDGEIYDARLELDYWNMPGYCDEGWKTVGLLNFNKGVLVPQSSGRVQINETIPANEIIITPEGDTVIDFGQNMSGWINFIVKGNVGDKVELRCFEVLDAKGNAYFDNLREAKETIIYYCKNSDEVSYHPNFTFQGFRYAKIVSYPGEILIDHFTAQVVHTEMERTGYFECSNPDINQLHHNILWGLKSNFVDIPSDCPQRNERMGWTGDAQIFCRTASYIMNTDTFFSKWLQDLAADQTTEGGVPHVVPDIISGYEQDDWLLGQGTHSAAAWADAAVIIPWTLYLFYGDERILRQQYKSMKAWINFMQEHADGIIWNYKLQFGDWVALDAEEGSYFGATPNDLTCTAYYAYSTKLFAKVAAVLGETEDSGYYETLYASIVSGFQKEFFTEDGDLTADTQTAYIIVLYFDLVPEIYKKKMIHRLLALLEKENGHLVTGFVGTPYFCHALSQNGCTKEAMALLLKEDYPSWLYQVKMGATTVWEHWDGMKPDGSMWSPDMNSFNHYAYGAIGEWLYGVLAGIQVDESKVGYKHSIINPHIVPELSYVKASYMTVYGEIYVHWQRKETETILEVKVPHNTTATIKLEPDTSLIGCDAEEMVECVNKNQMELGSGLYRFYLKA